MEPRTDGAGATTNSVRILCRNLLISKDPGLQWLIGSPFLPPFTILSTFRCLHSQAGDFLSPNFSKEADDLRMLLLRGFDIIGAICVSDANLERNATRAADASCKMRKLHFGDENNGDMIGASADLTTGDIQFFISKAGKTVKLEAVREVIYEAHSEKLLWELGCLLRCELSIKLPVYIPMGKGLDAEHIFSSAIDAAAGKLRDPGATYIVEGPNQSFKAVSQAAVFHSSDLDFDKKQLDLRIQVGKAENFDAKTTHCAQFYPKNKPLSPITVMESADAIRVTAFNNNSKDVLQSSAPISEYFPASEPASLCIINMKLDALCYAAKELPMATALSMLVIPGLTDQISTIKSTILPNLLTQHPQLHPYHFFPPGILHPITAIYELSYGETEMKQAEIRRSLHVRLGLPLDRPLLRIANALSFGLPKGNDRIAQVPRDVHHGIPDSGVSEGLASLIQGSYEYFHYLQDGFDDNGWGCAYRSLQTIISWFRLQHYTSIQVPSHREIQQALVEIGDKEPSFVGSREWIGAIELSFVLDKLLGVSCKVINVRSGSELPEKCRELALHFDTQGTPVMIGGGVLAYTLLGVDYNDASGDCAFLILDPHYTGTDDLKKIVGGGWCGWKKAVDSKGKNFFLHDKFYNLLLPQRPNMV